MRREILCVGEVLWDSLPLGLFPGGAPFNVALHLKQLGRDVAFISRIGDDVLGREILRRMRIRDLSTEFIQIAPELSTGFVEVISEDLNNPEYEIRTPAAWDAIELKPSILRAVKDYKALIFGSLAQREPTTHKTIMELVNNDILGIFDVNLRPPFDNREVVRMSLEASDFVKLNDHELGRMIEWYDLSTNFQDAIRSLAEKFKCTTICITQGKHGALLYHANEFYEHPGFQVENIDAVGAGDAFLAGLTTKLIFDREPPEKALEFANLLGAYVVTCIGATPELDFTAIENIQSAVKRERLD